MLLFLKITFAQNGCYINDGNGSRVFFVAHPDGNALHFTSTGSGTNYIVLNTGTYNCTNYSTSTFATNIGALGAACEVQQNSGLLTYTGNLITSFQVYQCPIDEYIWILVAVFSILGYLLLRKTIVKQNLISS
ncbi:hypothetical protein ACFOG5_10560 [Pedobacter fastidiosus]